MKWITHTGLIRWNSNTETLNQPRSMGKNPVLLVKGRECDMCLVISLLLTHCGQLTARLTPRWGYSGREELSGFVATPISSAGMVISSPGYSQAFAYLSESSGVPWGHPCGGKRSYTGDTWRAFHLSAALCGAGGCPSGWRRLHTDCTGKAALLWEEGENMWEQKNLTW